MMKVAVVSSHPFIRYIPKRSPTIPRSKEKLLWRENILTFTININLYVSDRTSHVAHLFMTHVRHEAKCCTFARVCLHWSASVDSIDLIHKFFILLTNLWIKLSKFSMIAACRLACLPSNLHSLTFKFGLKSITFAFVHRICENKFALHSVFAACLTLHTWLAKHCNMSKFSNASSFLDWFMQIFTIQTCKLTIQSAGFLSELNWNLSLITSRCVAYTLSLI